MKRIMPVSAAVCALVSAKLTMNNSTGKFRIMQVTDIHYGEDEGKDAKTTAFLSQLFQWEKPDLAVLTGDMVSGYAWDGKEQGWYAKQWQKWTTAFVDQSQPYMYIEGNHDSQADLPRDKITALDMSNKFSLTERPAVNTTGTSNYVKAVYDASGENKLFYLWAFDSMSDNCEGVTGWGCIEDPTVDWYKRKSDELLKEDGKALPGFAFFHIPLVEYLEMWSTEKIYGTRSEDVCCSSVNTGLFSAFKKHNNIDAVFCGHDHNNDYWGDYNGVRLHFGRKTGHGGYGPAKGMQRGVRMLEFSLLDSETSSTDAPSNRLVMGNLQMDSWIREEDGNEHWQLTESDKVWRVWKWWFNQKVCCGMKITEQHYFAENGFKSMIDSEPESFLKKQNDETLLQ